MSVMVLSIKTPFTSIRYKQLTKKRLSVVTVVNSIYEQVAITYLKRGDHLDSKRRCKPKPRGFAFILRYSECNQERTCECGEQNVAIGHLVVTDGRRKGNPGENLSFEYWSCST